MNDRLLHTPEGVRDIHTLEASKKNILQNKMIDVFHSYGFKEVQTPTFEYIDVFNHERGTIDIKMMYKFFDRDGHILALRPDITPSIARLVATAYKQDKSPKRICYLGNAFRNNESYQGKLREFTQAGVELIGANGPDTDAEIIALCVNSFLAAGLKEFQVDIGQAGFFKGLVEEAGLNAEYEEELRGLIDEKNYIAVEELLDSLALEETHQRILLDLPKLFGSVEVIDKARKLVTNKKAIAALNKLEKTYQILCDYGIEQYISFDLGMVSRINYYTGIVFRGYTFGTGVSIVDGGRYDGLLSQFGKDVPAVGFGIVIDELIAALERQHIKIPTFTTDTILIYNEESRKIAIQVSEQMRKKGMNIEIGLLNESLEANIAYGKQAKTGGIMHFITSEDVELINLNDDYRTKTTVEALLNEA